jgi:hypothetical protein
VTKLLRSTVGVVFEIVGEVLLWAYYGTRVVVLWGLFIFSGLAFVSGATEWGTSWWWGTAWVAGTVMMFKADNEGDDVRTELIAVALFMIALFGVFIQGAI